MANTEFQKICEFFRVNRLVLHPDKTKFILFTRSKIKQLNLNLVCNNNNPDQNLAHNISGIGQVQSGDMIPAVKFLGVFFDPDLNFKFHIGKLKNKLSRALFALRSVKNTLANQAFSFFTILFLTVTFFMQFRFGHVQIAVSLMNFSNFKKLL